MGVFEAPNLEGLGIQVFPSRPRTLHDKDKVEKRIRDLFGALVLDRRVYRDMADLQASVERVLAQLEETWRRGATGRSVVESFRWEQKFLRVLPERMPAVPLRELRCKVRQDGTVFFEGNDYQVPGTYAGKKVLCCHLGDGRLFFRRPEDRRIHLVAPGAGNGPPGRGGAPGPRPSAPFADPGLGPGSDPPPGGRITRLR